jgi:hypothetical protein
MEGSYNTPVGTVPSSAVRDVMRAVLEALGVPPPCDRGGPRGARGDLERTGHARGHRAPQHAGGCPREIEWTTGYLLPLTRHAFHGDWNHALHPQPRPVVPMGRGLSRLRPRSGTRPCFRSRPDRHVPAPTGRPHSNCGPRRRCPARPSAQARLPRTGPCSRLAHHRATASLFTGREPGGGHLVTVTTRPSGRCRLHR